VSIGNAVSHDAVLDLSALLAQADHALYRAKDGGRNRIEVASLELILDHARRSGADFITAVGCESSAATSAEKSAA
jgi:hypothetical protein